MTNITSQTDENHVDGINQSCVTVLKKSSASSTSGFALLSKQQILSGCKQVYDKINYSTFCRKAIRSKISRHLLSVHKSDFRLMDVSILPKRLKERMVKLEVLVNEGNFKHNIEVLKNKDGFLVVGRRENKERNFKIGNYLPCDFCKKFILITTLWLHHQNCSVARFMNNSNEAASGSDDHENVVRLSTRLLNSALLEESEIKLKYCSVV
ncbi:hypothetical protein DPMN_109622 [Dreissena polymorpha]|uniref:Uncharacterized protein n=1 Tax=Dreissena polymorpha TaxID=45954 RepID=A0A9D4QN43_DREPO|nr:hypothetical protein DPMN_109622 [Dreissena polymorpha]